jgi:hypothetical protein
LDHDADITKVQEWLGLANIAMTRIYDRRRSQPADSPTFKVSYRIMILSGSERINMNEVAARLGVEDYSLIDATLNYCELLH